MARLPALVDIHYLARFCLPMPFFQALENRENFCRLHHYGPNLSSLEAGVPDPDLGTLFHSPYLHTIHVRDQSHAAELFTAVLTDNSLSPNLKDVSLNLHRFLNRSPSLNYRPPLQGVQELLASGQSTSHSGDRRERRSFRSLVIDGCPISPGLDELLNSWTSAAELSQLKFLHFKTHAASSTTKFLAQSNFPALENLRLLCSAQNDIQYYKDIKQFVHRLHQLTNLELIKWDFNMLGLADCLGSRLKTLKLANFRENTQRYNYETKQHEEFLSYNINLSENEISQIVDSCPEIRELQIQFHRSRGDAAELRIYKLLGSLPQLRHLNLGLSASPPPYIERDDGYMDTAIEPHFNEFDKEYLPDRYPYRKGHYRDVLVNSAIDRKLAFYIFHAVSSGKGNGSVPLETLGVRACDSRNFADAEYDPWGGPPEPEDDDFILDFLISMKVGHTIRVSRDIRDDRRDLLQVSQLKGILFVRKEYVPEPMNKQDETCSAIYSLLWPAKEDAADY